VINLGLSGENLTFVCLALLAIAGGLLFLNLVKAETKTLALMLTFVSLAGLYVLLSAPVISVVQLVIYAGAVPFLALTAIKKKQDYEEKKPKNMNKVVSLIGSGAFAYIAYVGITDLTFSTNSIKAAQSSVSLSAYLILALGLFTIGLYSALFHSHPVLILLSIGLMMNAVNVNFAAFIKLGALPSQTGQAFSFLSITLGGCVMAIGVVLILLLNKGRETVENAKK
jgi:NADH:ubiquinone oxidoreductase subunit K